MFKKSYEEKLEDLIERMKVKDEFKQFEEYAKQIQKEDDYDDHDEDWYR